MLSLAFVASSFRVTEENFIIRNSTVWPSFLPLDVFTALKGTQFCILLYDSTGITVMFFLKCVGSFERIPDPHHKLFSDIVYVIRDRLENKSSLFELFQSHISIAKPKFNHLKILLQQGTFNKEFYEGHSRINDNEFISQKVLLESVFFLCHIRTHILPIYA